MEAKSTDGGMDGPSISGFEVDEILKTRPRLKFCAGTKFLPPNGQKLLRIFALYFPWLHQRQKKRLHGSSYGQTINLKNAGTRFAGSINRTLLVYECFVGYTYIAT